MLPFDHEPTEIEAIEYARLQVEDILRTSFGSDLSTGAHNLVGRLSTVPNNPQVDYPTSNELYGRCGPISYELQKQLLERGFLTDVCLSATKDNSGHAYLVAHVGNTEVLIDGSIGQFLNGFRHVFVGERKQLRQLVLTQTGEGNPYKIIHTRSVNNPQEAFERIWGSTSRVFVPGRRNR